jgi:membrane protease YdiL (CAAX protease family)
MTIFDDNPSLPPGQEPPANDSLGLHPEHEQPLTVLPAIPLTGDPISYAATSTDVPSRAAQVLPEDLRISWSWPHLIVFVIFIFGSLVTLQLAILVYFSADRHVSPAELSHLLESDPGILIGMNVLWFALILFFLYITLAVLRDAPFWPSLGWKKLKSDAGGGKGRPWMYFLAGCGLSIFVAIVSSRVKQADHMPIQDLLRNRTGALSLMAMAVFVAPLVEETVFRGYLYPVFARITSAALQFFGMEFSSAMRTGVASSILLTGALFGLMHGAQLGWTWGLVSLLTLVGVIFTFVRAWTGTVLASFLLHLGYNSFLAATSIIATRGFTHLPPVN